MKKVPQPNLKVIDRAINFLQKGTEVSAVDALDAALLSKYKWPSLKLMDLYYFQFKQFMEKSYGELPKHFHNGFWDPEIAKASKQNHLLDLYDFKRACIEAASN